MNSRASGFVPPLQLDGMPTTQTPTPASEPNEPLGTGPDPNQAGLDGSHPESGAPRATIATSRWVDYDAHELLDMISELEDERRWARLREGIWLAILIHFLVLSGITWIPKYVFKVPAVVDPFDAIQKRKDLSYLDLPPDLVKKYQQQPKVTVKPVPQKIPPIDRKTLEALNKPAPPRPASSSLRSRIRLSRSLLSKRQSSPRPRRLRIRRRFRRGPTLPWARRILPTSFATPCAGHRARPATTHRSRLPVAGSPCIPAPVPAVSKCSPIRRASISTHG